MVDPHVERLLFKIVPGTGVSYASAAPLTFENTLGRFDVRDGELVVEPADHFPSEAAARAVVEPFLRSWEIASDVEANVETIRFRFDRADVIDRNPLPPGSHVLMAGTSTVTFVGTVATLVLSNHYPAPPASFAATSEVIRAHARWVDYKAGRERLQAMGYFVLTLIEGAGGRKHAAQSLQIEVKILNMIGRLTSTKGSPSTARKAPPSGQFNDLTGEEQAWLEDAIPKVIKRLGERAAGATLTPLSLKDLRKL